MRRFLDPPTEDVTAHVLEMLAHVGVCKTPLHPDRDRVIAEGLAYLRRTQQPDGSWFGRWGVNYIYGTWCTISALAALRDAGYRVHTRLLHQQSSLPAPVPLHGAGREPQMNRRKVASSYALQ